MRKLAHELRYSEQLPEGVRRIDPRQWRYVKRRLEAVRTVFPGSAIIGGTALRIWCELRGRDIPEETSSPDIDILTPGTRFYKRKIGPQTGAVDQAPALLSEPFERPKFTEIDYEGDSLAIITPPHLMVNYASLIIDHAGRDLELSKYLGYYQISKNVLEPLELQIYTDGVTIPYGMPLAELMTQSNTIAEKHDVPELRT